MAELQVLNGPLQWKTFRLTGPRFLLGRKETCNLVLRDGWVSREHTVIVETSPGEFTVQDLGSENGIYINGTRVSESVALKHGDVLRVGRTEMRFFSPTGHDDAVPMPSARAPLPEPSEADMMDMTVHEPGGLNRPRTDLRERMRRLERLLNEKEEDNSRIASENAVLKRALAQGGLLDPATGRLAIERLTTPAAREAFPRHLAPLVTNPLSRVTWPQSTGGVLPPPARRDHALGVERLAVVGLGRAGTRLAEAFQAVGWRHVAAVASDEDVLEGSALAATIRIPAGLSDAREVAQSLEALDAPLGQLLDEAVSDERTLCLLPCGLGGVTGVGSLSPMVDLVAKRCPAVGVLVSVPSGERVAGEGRTGVARAGAGTLRRLHDAGKVRPVMVVDETRLAAFLGLEARTEWNATVAGLMDTILRLPLLPKLAGDLDRESMAAHLRAEGMSSFGLAGCEKADSASVTRALKYALGTGWLCSSMAPSRGTRAVLVLMVGNGTPECGPNWVSRLESSVNEVRQDLPQAPLSWGIYEDGGRGVRAALWVGGLPIPENLVP